MKPLQGVRIAVTRAAAQAEDLASQLRAQGAEVVITPLIRMVPAGSTDAVHDALRDLASFDWVIFTSANGVDAFAQAVRSARRSLAELRAEIACVGPATAAAAKNHGLVTTAMPEEFLGEAVAETLGVRGDLEGKRVLIARAAGGGQELPARLRDAGALVIDLELYRSVADPDGAARLRQHIEAAEVDVVTFTSGSTVRYFAQHVGLPGAALVAVIGPATAAVAREHGLNVEVEANPHTTAGLVESLVRHFGG